MGTPIPPQTNHGYSPGLTLFIHLGPLTLETLAFAPPADTRVPEIVDPPKAGATATKVSPQPAHKMFSTNIHAMTPEEQTAEIKEAFTKMESIPDIAQEKIGKTMWPSEEALEHPAGELLEHWARHGCPVDCGDDWSIDWIEAAIKRGAHITAKSRAAIIALRTETEDKLKGGYARLVRWGDIKKKFPKKLKISPIAAVPHKSRQFRMILDLSFHLRHKGIHLPSVNSATKLQAPAEAMMQLGHCVKRIIATLADNYDPEKPFAFSKLDIKDGF